MSTAPASNIPFYTPGRVRKRRATFFTLVFLTLVAGIWLLEDSLSREGLNVLEIAMLAVFAPLFYQLSVGFWTALIGLHVSGAGAQGPAAHNVELPAPAARAPAATHRSTR